MYGHVITKFSRMSSLPHFFTHGAQSSAIILYKMVLTFESVDVIL